MEQIFLQKMPLRGFC